MILFEVIQLLQPLIKHLLLVVLALAALRLAIHCHLLPRLFVHYTVKINGVYELLQLFQLLVIYYLVLVHLLILIV